MALTKAQDLKINAELYEAMMNQDVAKVINICRGIPKGPLHTLTIHEDTVIHMAIYQKQQNLALKLLDMVSSCDYHKLTWQNSGGNTILHETATNNRTVEVAKEILSRAPMLLNMINKEGETALFYAARHGKTKIYQLLHDEVGRVIDGPDLKTFLRRDDRFTILHIAIISRNYRVAYDIAINHKELIAEKDADGMTALQLLSTIRPEFRPKSSFKRIMFKLIDADVDVLKKEFFFFKKLKKEKHACEWALKIAALLIKEDNSWEKTESWTNNRGSKIHEYARSMSTAKPEQKITTVSEANYHKPDTPLLLATKHDSTEIVREILNRYPQAVEHVDKDGRNILHLAILYRRYEIIDIVEEMEYPLDRLRGRLDKNYNTLLHMVGQKVDELKEDVKHPAEQLKDDQRLYTRVEKICTLLDTTTRNSDEKTASEVFSETNDKLRMEAKEWMCENAKNCSVVAVLIATVAFTSAYTVPGGPDKSGHPVLRHEPMFLLFTLADAISLSASLTAVIIFLNIVTSPFRFKDFGSSLFEKQLTALILLIVAVAMMMVAFAATLVLTISNEATWSDMTLYGVSFFPVIVFMYSYSNYLSIIKDFYKGLKKLKEKVGVSFHKIWDYKPQSTHPVDGIVYLASRSPV
ncbi:hypothetical protein L1987_12704 [Smallanthus sonchifolius]|uniref:Uncharacterized protein n=1 Tax=Smallanthus sonchifolius TaxID=185202 RepID=A0ACB9JGW0_9ASTR|nr:hypothetical protein L1987_12704 [Smallanthus sonchifolius]